MKANADREEGKEGSKGMVGRVMDVSDRMFEDRKDDEEKEEL